MKKLTASLLAVIMLVALAGCGTVSSSVSSTVDSTADNTADNTASSPEPVVTEFCDALGAFDTEKASSCFASEAAALLSPYTEENSAEYDPFAAQAIEYLEGYAKDMTYVLGEAAVENDSAVVPVTFTYVDASPIILATVEDYNVKELEFEDSGVDDDDAYMLLFVDIFREKAVSVSAKTDTVTIEFNCVRQGDKWKIRELDRDTRYVIDNIISCNIYKALSEYGDGDGFFFWCTIPAGQVAELTAVKMTVTGCEERDTLTAEGIEPDAAQEGSKFVLLTVEVQNITGSELTFNNNLYLYDSQGREYELYSNASPYFEETLSDKELAPDETATGTLVYNIDSDAEDYFIVVAKDRTSRAYCLYAM